MPGAPPIATPPTTASSTTSGAGPHPVTRASGSRATPSRRGHVVGHHPSADPAAVQVDPHDRADADPVGDGVGHQVVELLVDGRHVGQDPRDTANGRARVRAAQSGAAPPAALVTGAS